MSAAQSSHGASHQGALSLASVSFDFSSPGFNAVKWVNAALGARRAEEAPLDGHLQALLVQLALAAQDASDALTEGMAALGAAAPRALRAAPRLERDVEACREIFGALEAAGGPEAGGAADSLARLARLDAAKARLDATREMLQVCVCVCVCVCACVRACVRERARLSLGSLALTVMSCCARRGFVLWPPPARAV